MATKSTKLVGDKYLENCAKMCEYPIDIANKFISVPETDLNGVQDNLMVQHLVKQHNFFIQSCIPGSIIKNKIFDPEIRLMQKPVSRSEFELNDEFLIKSTDCVLKIVYKEGNKIILRYTNRDKKDIATNIEQLRSVIKRGAWDRVVIRNMVS